jgi:hypothetical protein
MWRKVMVSSLVVFLMAVSVGHIAKALPPDKYVFPYDDTHPAPHFTAFCGFPVIIEEKGVLMDTIHYDASGNYLFETLIAVQGEAVITNALTGKSLTTMQTGLIKYGLDTASASGLTALFHVPGGGPIMLDAGRFIVDLTTGQRIFEAGTHDYIDGDWQALCNALATA